MKAFRHLFYLSLLFPNLGLIKKTTLSHLLLWFNLKTLNVSKKHFYSSVILFVFATSSLIGSFINFNSKTITQSLTLLSISLIYFLIGFTRPDNKSFSILFDWTFYSATISLIFYFLAPESIIRSTTYFFNNANLYNIGGIAAGWKSGLLPRLNLYTPEPSFFGFIWSSIFVFGVLRKCSPWKLVIIFIAILLTFSRTALVMILLFLIIKYRKKLFIVFFVSIPLLVPYFNDILASDLSFIQRFSSIGSAIDSWDDNYFFGIGWGAFYDYASVNFLDYKDIFNFHVRVMVETGLFGFSLYMLFWLSHFDLTQFFSKRNLGTFIIFVGLSSFSAYNLWVSLYLLALNSNKR